MIKHPAVAVYLLLSQRTEIILSQSADEAGAAEDVQQLSGFGISDSPVGSQTQQLSLLVADDGHRVGEGIDGFDAASHKLLHLRQRMGNRDGL